MPPLFSEPSVDAAFTARWRALRQQESSLAYPGQALSILCQSRGTHDWQTSARASTFQAQAGGLALPRISLKGRIGRDKTNHNLRCDPGWNIPIGAGGAADLSECYGNRPELRGQRRKCRSRSVMAIDNGESMNVQREAAVVLQECQELVAHKELNRVVYIVACGIFWRRRGRRDAYIDLLQAFQDEDSTVRCTALRMLRSDPGVNRPTMSATSL